MGRLAPPYTLHTHIDSLLLHIQNTLPHTYREAGYHTHTRSFTWNLPSTIHTCRHTQACFCPPRHTHTEDTFPRPHVDKHTRAHTHTTPSSHGHRQITFTLRRLRWQTDPTPARSHTRCRGTGQLCGCSAVTLRSWGLSGLCLITSCSGLPSSKLELQTLSRELSHPLSNSLLSTISPSVQGFHCFFPKTCSSSLFLFLSLSRSVPPLPPDLVQTIHLVCFPSLSCLLPRSVFFLPLDWSQCFPQPRSQHMPRRPGLLLCPLAPHPALPL